MFIPLFIAILLGLATPYNTNQSASCGGTTTVNTADADPGDTNPDDPNNPGDTPPGDDTGGEGGQIKIPK
ncbi:hypothetical protein ASE74_00260 [Pedobacter sp. Leaf216]|uniref:hypothetical protein n=1 Tax=Pedobacter sp. Leaf216 TaxID=1735684 RepID=UPI0007021A92|nr:hypothetical protein [Pedobacter sp. Leaf216]KQM79051.1 hypothetical protein ASE74_00260 [Pedobacter sp. Leaf216]